MSADAFGQPCPPVTRPMLRKLVILINCQLIESEGRARAVRAARSLAERTVTELILQHQNAQQLSSNLWAAVRARGCQFLGPGMFLCFACFSTCYVHDFEFSSVTLAHAFQSNRKSCVPHVDSYKLWKTIMQYQGGY